MNYTDEYLDEYILLNGQNMTNLQMRDALGLNTDGTRLKLAGRIARLKRIGEIGNDFLLTDTLSKKQKEDRIKKRTVGDKTFKNLTDGEKRYIAETYNDKSRRWEDRFEELVEWSGRNERTVRKWFGKLNLSNAPEIPSPQFEEAKRKEHDPTKKVFLVTWAQNDTPVHSAFLTNLESYAQFRNASIHVIAGRYKNPTSVFTDKKYDTWADEILPYLDANRHSIHEWLTILSDVKIQPTAINPMTGMQGMSGVDSCIFGSPKVQLETIPVLEGQKPKLMMTTGACTLRNYTDSKAGKKGEFHHTLGFVVVEIKDDETFFIRQVTAHHEDGSFCDLYYRVSDGEIERLDTIEAIVLGDLHIGDHDEEVLNGTLYDLMEELEPNHIILHDVFNAHSITHHDEGDPFKLYEKHQTGTNLLKNEIEEMLHWLERLQEWPQSKVVVVRSNHDDTLDRWLKRADWKKDIPNSLEYVEYASILLRGEAPKGIIPYVIEERYPEFITLDRSSSYKVGDWELGHHGDVGAHGSRGSIHQFRKANTKLVVGHYHAPQRKDGALAVGTSTKLRLDYNLGMSGWMQGHVIIHEDGKAQHILFTGEGGEYTTMK